MKNTFTKSFKLGLAIFSLTGSVALAQTPTDTQPKNLVTLTGNLNPAYSVEMSEADRAALAQGIEGINNMPSITVDINSIYSEKDKPAFEAASKEVSRVLLEAAKKLVDMRAIVYKLDISLQQDAQHRFTENIYNAYNKKFQNSFTDLLQLFLGTDDNFNANLTNAMEACFTTSCLQDIASAQLDLIEFGKAINTRIDLSSSKAWEYKNSGFKSRLVKDAVRLTIDEVLKTNQEESAYVKMLRTAATPFAAAAAGTNQAFDNMSGFIRNQKTTRYLIAANPILKKSKAWAQSQDNFETRVGENYELIVANNGGAKQYLESKIESSQSINNTSMLKPALNRLDKSFIQLSKLNGLSKDSALQMISSLITTSNDEFDEYLSFLLDQTIATLDKTLVPSTRFGSYGDYYFSEPVVGYGSSISLNDNGYYKNNWKNGSIFKTAKGNTMIYCTGVDGTKFSRLYSISSPAGDVRFFIVITVDAKDYLIETDGNIRVNLNAKQPTVKIISLKK